MGMTIKQLCIGSAIGATALGIMLHRCLPKHTEPLLKAEVKPAEKAPSRVSHARLPRNENDERLSMNKLFGHHSQ
jgi:hypothetical protein